MERHIENAMHNKNNVISSHMWLSKTMKMPTRKKNYNLNNEQLNQCIKLNKRPDQIRIVQMDMENNVNRFVMFGSIFFIF